MQTIQDTHGNIHEILQLLEVKFAQMFLSLYIFFVIFFVLWKIFKHTKVERGYNKAMCPSAGAHSHRLM